jgi:two-component system cell cycle response regulator DivK
MLAGTDYEITEAEDGEQALAAVAKARPDLILMGSQLPIMDGYEVTRQIKADPAMRSIPIIAVTSHALDGEEQTARAAGCDGYVRRRTDACFVVRDHSGEALAYVYYENEPGRRSAVKLLTKEEARRIAAK